MKKARRLRPGRATCPQVTARLQGPGRVFEGANTVPRHSREGPWQGPLGARGSGVLESLYGGREVKTHHVLRRPTAAGSGFRGDAPPGAGCGLPAVGVRGRVEPRQCRQMLHLCTAVLSCAARLWRRVRKSFLA